VPSSSRRRTLRPGRIDGLKVQVIDAPSAPAVDVNHALRLLARMLVRSSEARREREAISDEEQSGSTLTVSPNPRPDHVDDAA
jgi:hypothetical protein